MPALRFIRSSPARAAAALVEVLEAALNKNQRVLWLVSGGSNIATEAAIIAQLIERGAAMRSLAILPIDERYGDYDHPDSNSAQLRAAVPDLGEASMVDVLEKNLTFKDTIAYYNSAAEV